MPADSNKSNDSQQASTSGTGATSTAGNDTSSTAETHPLLEAGMNVTAYNTYEKNPDGSQGRRTGSVAQVRGPAPAGSEHGEVLWEMPMPNDPGSPAR
ncbi:hypothetical protein IAT38_002603 [Cryptococcus sp. DSM 104549]